MSRWARRKDTTHKPIADALEACGKVVFDVSSIGGLGFDIIVYDPSSRLWMAAELKSDKKIHHKSADKALKPSQIRAIALAPIQVFDSVDQALKYFQE